MKAGSVKPRAVSLLNRVPGGAQIIKNEGAVLPTPEATVTVPPVVETKPVEVQASSDSAKEYDFDVGTAPVVTPPPAPAAAPDSDDVETLAEPKDPIAANNFRKLRNKYKATNDEKKRLAEESENLRKKVQDYETGVALPEIVQNQADRIAGLEKYEQLFNFRGSPVYQEKYARPMEADSAALVKIAGDYGVSDDVIKSAVATDNEAERDRILSQSFPNTLGAIEAKTLIARIRATQSAAKEAEGNASSSAASLQQENDAIVASRVQRAREVISHTAKEGWQTALSSLRQDERFADIHWRAGDSAHNEQYVKPILTRASQEYGKTIRMLAEAGLSNLPKELAIKLSNSDVLAHYAGLLVHERNELAKKVSELESAIKRSSTVNRPSMHGGTASYTNGSHASAAPNQAVGSGNAGAKVLSRVTGR